MEAIATSGVGPRAPNYRVRLLIPRANLATAGVSLTARPLLTGQEESSLRQISLPHRALLLGRASRRQRAWLTDSDARTILVSRQADLLPTLACERAAAQSRRLIYDVDDAIWLSGTRSAGGHPLAVLKRSKAKAEWLARRAATVVAGNEILAEWLSRHAERVVVIPSVVEPSSSPRKHETKDDAVVGWIGSDSTAAYLRAAGTALTRVAQALRPKRLKLLIVGGPAFALPGVRVEAIPWSESNEQEALSKIDVGLMPLPDNAWTRGKCAYKAIQYMSAGIPVVADDVGIARSVIEGHGAGLVARPGVTWEDALGQLLSDTGARTELGAAGRQAVEREFSPRRWGPVLAGILKGGD